jgi:hypothetical protein
MKGNCLWRVAPISHQSEHSVHLEVRHDWKHFLFARPAAGLYGVFRRHGESRTKQSRIMSIGANHGRKAALAFALGVISGSMFWAAVASLGVSAALVAWSQFIIAAKIFGGLYLLWLAFKSGPVACGWSGCRVGLSPTGKAPPSHGAGHEPSFTVTWRTSADERGVAFWHSAGDLRCPGAAVRTR